MNPEVAELIEDLASQTNPSQGRGELRVSAAIDWLTAHIDRDDMKILGLADDVRKLQRKIEILEKKREKINRRS